MSVLTVSSDTWNPCIFDDWDSSLTPVPSRSPPSPASLFPKLQVQCRSTENLLSHQAIRNELLTLPSHPQILNDVFPAKKDVLPRSHKTTIRIRKLTSPSYYRLVFRSHSLFPVVSMISFTAKGPVQDHALYLSCLLLVSFNKKPFLSFFSLGSRCFEDYSTVIL